MFHFHPSAIRFLSTAALVGAFFFASASLGLSDDLTRAAQTLRVKYIDDLKQLAAWCEEKGLKEQSRQTLAVLGPQDPTKYYLPILPDDVGPAKVPDGAAPDVVEWDARLNRIRRDQATALYNLAQRAVRIHPGLALELALDAIRVNPDNESVRRLLGYQKYQNQWHTLYELKKLRSGMVWSDKFGWLPKASVRRYEEGQRYFDGKWISVAEDAQRHGDIRTGWEIETEHYNIRTNHSIEAGVALGVKLEDLYRLWKQMFIRYFVSEADVIAMFEGRTRSPKSVSSRHQVVFFRDQEDYIRSLRAMLPSVDKSIGVYYDATKSAYFFAGKDSDDRTLYHEGTHQLFHESRAVSPNVGRKANFWIIEGIAMYMESLKKENGFYVLGGFNDERMVAARYRLLKDKFYIPLEQLTIYGMERLQQDPKIATIYSQSAGLTHFLVHYDRGRYRDALVSYLASVYTGQDNSNTLAQLVGVGYGEIDKQYREFMENEGKDGAKSE